MYAIQWFDPYSGYTDAEGNRHASKDGVPRGHYATEKLAKDAAEQAVEAIGAFDVTYEIVSPPAYRSTPVLRDVCTQVGAQ